MRTYAFICLRMPFNTEIRGQDRHGTCTAASCPPGGRGLFVHFQWLNAQKLKDKNFVLHHVDRKGVLVFASPDKDAERRAGKGIISTVSNKSTKVGRLLLCERMG